MKKIFVSITILYIFLFFLEFSFNYFKKHHEVTYKIDNIEIKEDYRGNTKEEENNYYLELKTEKNTFYIQTYEDFKKEKRIIKQVKYYSDDNYECILPIFKKNTVLTDLICIKDGKQINYNTIQNSQITEFLNTISEYPKENYKDNLENVIMRNQTRFYPSNLPKEHYIALTYYKGLLVADETSFREIELFKKDVYTQKIKAFTNNKYLIINYNNNYDSNEFYVVNLKTRQYDAFGSNNTIKYDAYIQGTLENSVYLFDKDSKNQYQLDLKEKTITRIGNTNTGIKYYDGTWQNKNAYEAVNKELKFKEYETTDEYIMIKKIRGKKYGTTIYVKEVNGVYEVYRGIRDNQNLIYLFTTTDYKTMNFLKDYIYYKDGIYIKMYSDLTGIKTIMNSSEITNKSVSFYIGENIWKH